MYKVKLSRIYKKLLVIFLIACFVLVIFIVFVVFNKAVVKVKAEDQVKSVDFPVNIIVGADDQSALSISGKLNDVIIEKEKEFAASGRKKVENDVIGTVKIINNYSKRISSRETIYICSRAENHDIYAPSMWNNSMYWGFETINFLMHDLNKFLTLLHF